MSFVERWHSWITSSAERLHQSPFSQIAQGCDFVTGAKSSLIAASWLRVTREGSMFADRDDEVAG